MVNNISEYSLANLPNELLEDITKCVIGSSFINGAQLGKLTKALRHWKSQAVCRECPIGPLHYRPTIRYSDAIRSLVVAMRELCLARKPDALYGEGITTFSDNIRSDRVEEGVTQLRAAAEKCHIKARFLYGLILVCTNVERRGEGFTMLATLRNDLTKNYLPHLQGGAFKAVEILAEYEPDCSYDGDDKREYMNHVFE